MAQNAYIFGYVIQIVDRVRLKYILMMFYDKLVINEKKIIKSSDLALIFRLKSQ